MSWEIDLFRIRPGQDPCKVRDVQYDWEQHDGYVIVDTATAETDDWIKRALELLESVSPGFKLAKEHDGELALNFDTHRHIRHVRIWQPEGPLIANLYPDFASLRVNTWAPKAYDGEWFDHLWAACRILAEEADCAVFPQYDDDPVDMTLDPKEARRVHHWA
jgi:hypothetical protein